MDFQQGGEMALAQSNVKNMIKEFIYTQRMIGRPPDSLKDSDSLLEKGILDSTGVLELVGYLEENFGFSVEDLEMIPENLGSIDNIVTYVQKKIGVAI
jgi:acyl carrier protein